MVVSKRLFEFCFVVVLAALLFVAYIAVEPSVHIVMGRTSQSRFTEISPVVVNVRRTDGRLEYRMDSKKYSKDDLNSRLAEIKLESLPRRRVLIMLDESTYLGDIKLVPQMATDAGFTDVQAYAVFEKTGNMAEVLFGPVKKISRNPDPHRE